MWAMPIYEYRRLTDGEVIEVIQKSGEAPLEKCPETGDPVEKLISKSAFHLKGAGWYVSDYANKASKDSAKPAEEKESAATDSTKTDSSASAESKPAEKEISPASTEKPKSETTKKTGL